MALTVADVSQIPNAALGLLQDFIRTLRIDPVGKIGFLVNFDKC
jgi:hypothetical protein